MKFHEDMLKSFKVTTQPIRKIYFCQFQRVITPKIWNSELGFLHPTRHLMLVNDRMTFHEGTLNGYQVTRTDTRGLNSNKMKTRITVLVCGTSSNDNK